MMFVVGLFLFVIYRFKPNIVIGVMSGTFLFLTALYLWIYGINIPLQLEEGRILYQGLPSLVSNSLGFAIIIFSLWVIYAASFRRSNDNEIM
jgi:hypothetical protein